MALRWYNFVRVHQTLRVTPAMEAGISDRVWSIADIVALLDATNLSVKEVAGVLGYVSTAVFDRQFKRWLRMTPGQFRLAVWQCGTGAKSSEADIAGMVLRRLSGCAGMSAFYAGR